MDTISRRRLLAALGSTLAAPSLRAADAYPNRPIKVIIPFVAGGPTDTVARPASEKLQELLRQPVIVESHAGANGQIGGQYVARAPADGYTLLFATIHYAVAPSLYTKLPYDVERDFAPVCLAADYPTIICVNDKLPVQSVRDLIAYAKANPGKLSFGSSGNGGATHLAGELFKHMAGVDMLHVPYKGSAAAMQDLIGGQVQVMFCDAPTAMPQIQGKRIRPIATGSARRAAALPDLPTVAEAGLPGYAADTWTGVMVAAATPKPIVRTLNEAFVKIFSDPQVVRQLASVGAEARPGTPEQFGQKLHAEIGKWRQVVQQAHVTVD